MYNSIPKLERGDMVAIEYPSNTKAATFLGEDAEGLHFRDRDSRFVFSRSYIESGNVVITKLKEF